MEVDASDARTITASLDDPREFATVFDRHAAVLFRFLVRRVGRDTADDLLGDTFRIAFERRATFDTDRDTARPWLYGIATNLVAKHRRTEGRRLRATARAVAGASTEHSEPIGDSVAAGIDAGNEWPLVALAIADLPDGERDALLLFVWEELSYDEIALALDVPIGTVRSRLNRARRRLREPITACGQEEVTS